MSDVEELFAWHESQGGRCGRIAGHALRLLHEVVELCAAAGASEKEIYARVDYEVAKADDRGEFGQPVDLAKVRDEVADCAMLLAVLGKFAGTKEETQAATRAKFAVVLERKWEADEDGVLWRPGGKPGSFRREGEKP